MDLNQNIKSIIYNYYTYSDRQIKDMQKDWQNKINKVNIFFNINFCDFMKECYICKDKDHLNRECPIFYHNIHTINSTGKQSY